MIDYKEFCDRFWLAANDKEQQQLYSYRFGKKSFFARSNWLSSDLSVSEPIVEEEDFSMGENISIISAKATNRKSETIVETPKKMPAPSKLGLSLGDLSTTFAAGAKISLNTRHMADLSIESAKLLPKELEQGGCTILNLLSFPIMSYTDLTFIETFAESFRIPYLITFFQPCRHLAI